MTSQAIQLNENIPVFDTPVFRSTHGALASGIPLVIQQGGTYSGKTYSILLSLIEYLKESKDSLTVSVVSCTFPHLKRGAMRDFADIMDKVGGLKDWNKTDCIGHIGNSIIEFFSADNDGKVRGGKRDVLFVNEANLINYERFRQLSMRTRQTTVIDFNPVSEFWLHDQVLPGVQEGEYLFRRTTYKDNPRTPEKVVKDIEALKLTDAQLYRVYALGKTGNITGLIFPNVTYVDQFPEEAKKQAYGLDFGFTNDPTALVRIGFLSGKLYLQELIYETGLTNPDISNRIKELGVSKRAEIVADAAEPKSIEELRRMGWNVWPGTKREIVYGIDLMRRHPLCVTKDSLNLAKELRNYAWKVDASGRSLNVPIDAYNHCFVGQTLIETSNGEKPISEILPGEYVKTSSGYNLVLKKWNNGNKQVFKHLIQLDTFSISLTCTSNHLIKTSQGWKEISQLKSGMTVYLSKSSMAKCLGFTPASDTFQGAQQECMLSYGNTSMAAFQKGFMFTIKMKTLGITGLKTLSAFRPISTLASTAKRELKKTLNGLMNFTEKALQRHRSGTGAKRAERGIPSMVKSVGIAEDIKPTFVNTAANHTKQDTPEFQSFVITTVKQQPFGSAAVYDLTVENEHEYFANGLLVHNCLDGVRYAVIHKLAAGLPQML
jgi:phage terminase large subunit